MKVVVGALLVIGLSVGGFVFLWFFLAPPESAAEGLRKLGCQPTIEYADAGVVVAHCGSPVEDAALPSCDAVANDVRKHLGRSRVPARVIVEAAGTVRCVQDVARDER
jgi:hypothetical protein